ncbi:LysR family transcriptional regulator [Streptomyces sp. NPDC094144]
MSLRELLTSDRVELIHDRSGPSAADDEDVAAVVLSRLRKCRLPHDHDPKGQAARHPRDQGERTHPPRTCAVGRPCQRGTGNPPSCLHGPGAWDRLREFAAVSRYRTLKEAAEALGTHHTALITRVGRLRREIGHPLLTRTTTASPMKLTQIGEAVVAAIHATGPRNQGWLCADLQDTPELGPA